MILRFLIPCLPKNNNKKKRERNIIHWRRTFFFYLFISFYLSTFHGSGNVDAILSSWGVHLSKNFAMELAFWCFYLYVRMWQDFTICFFVVLLWKWCLFFCEYDRFIVYLYRWVEINTVSSFFFFLF